MLCSHPVQTLLQWMSTGLAGKDTGIISSLASGVQSHSDMTAVLITQVSQQQRRIRFSRHSEQKSVVPFPSKTKFKSKLPPYTHHCILPKAFFRILLFHTCDKDFDNSNSKLSSANTSVKLMAQVKPCFSLALNHIAVTDTVIQAINSQYHHVVRTVFSLSYDNVRGSTLIETTHPGQAPQ